MVDLMFSHLPWIGHVYIFRTNIPSIVWSCVHRPVRVNWKDLGFVENRRSPRVGHFSVSIICLYLFDIWTNMLAVSLVELESESNFSLCTFYSFARTHVVSSDSDVV